MKKGLHVMMSGFADERPAFTAKLPLSDSSVVALLQVIGATTVVGALIGSATADTGTRQARITVATAVEVSFRMTTSQRSFPEPDRGWISTCPANARSAGGRLDGTAWLLATTRSTFASGFRCEPSARPL